MSENPIAEAVDEVKKAGKGIVNFLGHAIGRPNIDLTGTIFVTCATGVIGHRATLRLLHTAKHPSVRVGARDPARVEALSKEGAEVADFCWGREDTYAKALDGVKTVFCITPYMENWDRKYVFCFLLPAP